MDGVCSEELGVLILRVHDIVRCKYSNLRNLDKDTWEECRQSSVERWMKGGLAKIDLERFQNPISYLIRGSYLNMLSRLKRIRKQQMMTVPLDEGKA